MNVATAILVFVVAWWMILFMVLPFGVRRADEVGGSVPEGTEPGAPVRPHLKVKALVTTVLAAASTLTFHLLLTFDVL